MENAAVKLRNVDIVGNERRIGAVDIEKRALAGRLHRHDVGERGGNSRNPRNERAVKPSALQRGDDEIAGVVVAELSERLDRDRRIQNFQVDARIAHRSADGTLDGRNLHQHSLVGPA